MNFDKEVLEASKDVPVLVDFWAPWCGPCQTLGPVLESMEVEQDRWKLVKVNVDENQDISQRFQIRGIPDVRMFVEGKEVGKFTGAYPKHEIEKWLKAHMPDGRLKDLNTFLKEEKWDELKSFVESNPDFYAGTVALAKHVVWEDPKYARDLVKNVPLFEKEHTYADAVMHISEMMLLEKDEGSKVNELLLNASEHLQRSDFEHAIELLISSVMMDKTYNDDLPRRATIAFFVLMGADNELTKKYRRRFDMALY